MDQPPHEQGPRRHTLTIGRATMIAVVIALTGILVILFLPSRHHRTQPTPVGSASAATSSEWSPSSPSVPADVTVAWAYLDSTEGDLRRGGDQGLHPLDQLVVPGLAADYLARLGADPTRDQQADLYAALTGDKGAADHLAEDVGGVQAGMERVINSCSLADTRVGPARATVTDIARYAACLREGAIADPDQSAWVIDQMRNTPGGIGELRGNDGGQRLAQFISTVPGETGRMRTGCMAVGAYWSAAVLVDWPATEGALYGSGLCGDVARAEFPPDTQQAPDSPAPTDPSPTCPYETCRGTD